MEREKDKLLPLGEAADGFAGLAEPIRGDSRIRSRKTVIVAGLTLGIIEYQHPVTGLAPGQVTVF